jgi:hypothetical protein
MSSRTPLLRDSLLPPENGSKARKAQMGLFPVIVYAALCVLVGWRGANTQLGFWGTTVLSLLLTPVIMFIGLIIFQSRSGPGNSGNMLPR